MESIADFPPIMTCRGEQSDAAPSHDALAHPRPAQRRHPPPAAKWAASKGIHAIQILPCRPNGTAPCAAGQRRTQHPRRPLAVRPTARAAPRIRAAIKLHGYPKAAANRSAQERILSNAGPLLQSGKENPECHYLLCTTVYPAAHRSTNALPRCAHAAPLLTQRLAPAPP